jgi:hypothetical protein
MLTNERPDLEIGAHEVAGQPSPILGPTTDVARDVGPLRAKLDEYGVPLKSLTVLATQNDPFRVDTSAGHRDGAWLTDSEPPPPRNRWATLSMTRSPELATKDTSARSIVTSPSRPASCFSSAADPATSRFTWGFTTVTGLSLLPDRDTSGFPGPHARRSNDQNLWMALGEVT